MSWLFFFVGKEGVLMNLKLEGKGGGEVGCMNDTSIRGEMLIRGRRRKVGLGEALIVVIVNYYMAVAFVVSYL